jgi:hypothetical protein
MEDMFDIHMADITFMIISTKDYTADKGIRLLAKFKNAVRKLHSGYRQRHPAGKPHLSCCLGLHLPVAADI